jgi:hypothetical protein
MITDTGVVAQALNTAQGCWPDLRRQEALRRLIEWGAVRAEEERAAHDAAVEALASFKGTFPPGYLEGVRDGWPL